MRSTSSPGAPTAVSSTTAGAIPRSGLEVHPCAGCGAPLPLAVDGQHARCEFCGAGHRIDEGAAAVLVERATRAQAERLFATLASPPSLLARVAVVLTNGAVWLTLSPFVLVAFAWLGSLPVTLLGPYWERTHHARLTHVLPPRWAFLLSAGPTFLAMALMLLLATFGARVTARRALQAALACKPAPTGAGAAQCRSCGADLVVPEGAVAVRCAHCQATNLVALPPAWVAGVEAISTELTRTMGFARAQRALGRRKMAWAAAWRLPLAISILWFVGARAQRLGSAASFDDLHLHGDTGAFEYMARADGDTHIRFASLVDCADGGEQRVPARSRIVGNADANMCEGRRCEAWAMFALAHGDRLRVRWTDEAPGELSLGLASRNFIGGFFGAEGYAEPIAHSTEGEHEAGALALEARAQLSGYYVLHLIGVRAASFYACVERAHGSATETATERARR